MIKDRLTKARTSSGVLLMKRLRMCLLLSFLLRLNFISQDWPQFLGPTRDGLYPGVDLASSWAKGGPPVVWKKVVGQGFSSPVVSSGRLVLFHRLDDHETIECLEAKTGQALWSFRYPASYRDDFGFDEGPRSTPAIADGRIYAFGAEGWLHCLDLATGKKLWGVNTHLQFGVRKGYFGAACSPLVEGRAVVLNIGGSKPSGLVAFDRESGNVLWTATDHEASYSSPTAATVRGVRHLLALTRFGLVDVDPATGKVRFEFPWRARIQASVNAATPLWMGDHVFISASYQTGAAVLQIDGYPPKKLWSSDDALSNHYATSVIRNGYLYGYHGRQEHGPSLRCVEFQTGRVMWTVDQFRAGTVTLAGDQLLLLKENGELVLAPASPKGFQPVAHAKLLPATVRSYPALAQGLLYARNDGTLVCVNLRK
jgi:outer membrane protein assembly factor BamB